MALSNDSVLDTSKHSSLDFQASIKPTGTVQAQQGMSRTN